MTDMHATGGEVDLERRLLVNATQIAHEYAIDVHPDVVVTRELKDHILAFGGLATVRLDKLRGHGHAKVVVELIVRSVRYSYRREPAVPLFKNLVSRVKGEELTPIRIRHAVLIYARLIVDVKGVSREVIHSIVAVRAVRIVNVIAILELEKALYVVVNGLAVLLAICLAVVIKEIIERLVFVRTVRVIRGVGASIDRRIALYQCVLHKRKTSKAANNTFSRPFINTRSGAAIELELMVFIDAGVVILVVVVYVLRAVVVAVHDPVVEQIDRSAGGIHRLHGMVAKRNRLIGRRTRRTKHERTRRQRDGQNPQGTLGGIGFLAKRL